MKHYYYTIKVSTRDMLCVLLQLFQLGQCVVSCVNLAASEIDY